MIYASQEQYRIIEQTIKEIDQPQLQVAIDATIAEVTLTDDLQYGIQSYIMSRDVGLKPNTGSVGFNGATSVAAAAADVVLQRAIPGFNFLVGSAQTPRAVLNALHAITDVKVLSNPSVVVIDNQVATLQVGDEIPIQTGSATVLTGNNTIANTTDYRSTGIILRVVPRINANGNVRLDVEQEISNPVSNSSSGSSSTSTNSLTPTVSTRKVRSSVAVASGQTVLLAGLISDTQTKRPRGHSGPRPDSRPRRSRVRADGQAGQAHRAYHLHPAADHPRRRRCSFRCRGAAHQAARYDQRDRAEARADDLPLSQYKLPEERFT
ncbi:type II secretory pathway component GspD/PulD (secretin) [Bradyrhizobium sp. i1.3.1]